MLSTPHMKREVDGEGGLGGAQLFAEMTFQRVESVNGFHVLEHRESIHLLVASRTDA
jgi:hypothetical protein